MMADEHEHKTAFPYDGRCLDQAIISRITQHPSFDNLCETMREWVADVEPLTGDCTLCDWYITEVWDYIHMNYIGGLSRFVTEYDYYI